MTPIIQLLKNVFKRKKQLYFHVEPTSPDSRVFILKGWKYQKKQNKKTDKIDI